MAEKPEKITIENFVRLLGISPTPWQAEILKLMEENPGKRFVIDIPPYRWRRR